MATARETQQGPNYFLFGLGTVYDQWPLQRQVHVEREMEFKWQKFGEIHGRFDR